MKKQLILLAVLLITTMGANAQLKKDGTPDMRYNSNKQTYGNSYKIPSYSTPKTERNYKNGGQFKIQDGYQKRNGRYVAPHLKTTPDNNLYNNRRRRNK